MKGRRRRDGGCRHRWQSRSRSGERRRRRRRVVFREVRGAVVLVESPPLLADFAIVLEDTKRRINCSAGCRAGFADSAIKQQVPLPRLPFGNLGTVCTVDYIVWDKRSISGWIMITQ